MKALTGNEWMLYSRGLLDIVSGGDLDLNYHSDLTKAYVRASRLATLDYQWGQYKVVDGEVFKLRDRRPERIATMIRVAHWRVGHVQVISQVYKTTLWSLWVNQELKTLYR